jgi:hypothetical protein
MLFLRFVLMEMAEKYKPVFLMETISLDAISIQDKLLIKQELLIMHKLAIM